VAGSLMTAEIFGPTLGGPFALLILWFWAMPISALVSVASQSKVAFYQAHSSKTAWIIILAVGLLLSPVGLFFSLYYFVFVRRRVRKFDRSADT
jgi:Na+/citrate or Na+/malate symporter